MDMFFMYNDEFYTHALNHTAEKYFPGDVVHGAKNGDVHYRTGFLFKKDIVYPKKIVAALKGGNYCLEAISLDDASVMKYVIVSKGKFVDISEYPYSGYPVISFDGRSLR